jgi:hypothetical protein
LSLSLSCGRRRPEEKASGEKRTTAKSMIASNIFDTRARERERERQRETEKERERERELAGSTDARTNTSIKKLTFLLKSSKRRECRGRVCVARCVDELG